MAAVATLVAFHAHPDDEPLPTGGTLARAAAEGHRVPVFGLLLGCEWYVEAPASR